MDIVDDSKEGILQSPYGNIQNSSTHDDKATVTAKDSVYTFSDNCDSDEGELKYKIKNLIQSPTNDESASDEDNEYSGSTCEDASTISLQRDSIKKPHANASHEIEHSTSSTTSSSGVLVSDPIPILPKSTDAQSPSATPSPALSSDVPASVVLPVRVRRVPNGSIPKTGKPMAYAIEKKATRVRSKPKRKALVAMYQSQISDNKIGIKLKLKKSDIITAVSRRVGSVKNKSKKAPKSNRKRSRKSRPKDSSDDSDNGTPVSSEKRTRKEKVNNNKEPEEQTIWGSTLPEPVLYKIFKYAVKQEGALPTLVRLGKVCSLWQRVSVYPMLWQHVDLARYTKERTELKLKWIIENRLSACEDINLTNWKVTNICCVLIILAETCPNLIGLTLSGWKGFSSENLIYLVEQFKSLRRIDLSSINIEMSASKSSVGLQSLCTAIQMMNDRLTHLNLSHNRLAGIPQIVTALSTHCPNLLMLDLSNVSTMAISHGILHIEKLQQGCQKLKVLRVTNSHIILGAATLQEQMDSPGFPDLEELSIASLADESRLFNDEFLQRILKTSTKLQLLDVRGCARLTHDSLIRLPTWDLKHLFLSGCSVTRDVGSGLELIASKWAHSLIEFDLAWANVQDPIDNAIKAIAEKGVESPLNHLNLCGSSVSLEAVKEILTNCSQLNSINLSSCRGLPRGVKRLLQGSTELKELRDNLGVTLKTHTPNISEPSVSTPVAATTDGVP